MPKRRRRVNGGGYTCRLEREHSARRWVLRHAGHWVGSYESLGALVAARTGSTACPH